MIARSGIAAAIVAIGSCASQSATGADLGSSPASIDPTHPFFSHRFLFQGGAQFNTIATDATVGTVRGGGTHISLEDDLRFASQHTSFDGMMRFRISDRWVLEGQYFEAPRSSSATASTSIGFGRLTFPASASVSGDFDISSLRLALGYAFYKSSDAEVGVAVSVFSNSFSVSLAGNATVGGLAAGFQTEKFSAAVPLPTLGLYANYAFTSRWLVSGRVDYMDLSMSSFTMFGYDLRDVSARVLSLDASTEYRLFENLGIGIGYRYQEMSAGASKGGLHGDISYKVSAPTAFVRASF